MIAALQRRSSPGLYTFARARSVACREHLFTALVALIVAAPACSDRVSGPPYAGAVDVHPSGGSTPAINASSASSASSTGGAGGMGGAGGAGVTNVAVGGCYDAATCGIPNDEGTTALGCVGCVIPEQCQTQDLACRADAACSLVYTCVLDCGSTSCINACLAQTPEGATAYRALLTCGYCNCSLTSICTQDRNAITPPIRCP